MSDADVSPQLSVIQGASERHSARDDPKQATLSRSDVAKRLGVSLSTVRRLEGSQLEPHVGQNGVRRFTPGAVERLAAKLAAERDTPREIQKAATRVAELTKGELAALVFERLEQRHSLAEIVIALRVPPEEVRALYHVWLVGLWSGELLQREPALPSRHTDADVARRVAPGQLARMLAALPPRQATRISIARRIGEYMVDDVEYRNLSELGGFEATGSAGLHQIVSRVGAGEYRVTAYGLEPPGLRWEVFVTLSESDADLPEDASEELPSSGV